MSAPKRKPATRRTPDKPAPIAQPEPVTDEQDQDEELPAAPEPSVEQFLSEEEPTTQPEAEPVEPEPEPQAPLAVRQFAAAIRAKTARIYWGKPFEPKPGVPVMFGYNGLSRVFGGHQHVHVATVDEIAEWSDQEVYDAVMKARIGR